MPEYAHRKADPQSVHIRHTIDCYRFYHHQSVKWQYAEDQKHKASDRACHRAGFAVFPICRIEPGRIQIIATPHFSQE